MAELQAAFDFCGGDVFAARCDDDIFQTPSDGEKARLIHPPDVASAKPAISGKGLGGLLRQVPVAFEIGQAVALDFAIICDPHRDARHHGPHSAQSVGRGAIDGASGGILGHAIALIDRNPYGAIPAQEGRADRGCSGNTLFQAIHTQKLAQIAKNQHIRQPHREALDRPQRFARRLRVGARKACLHRQ